MQFKINGEVQVPVVILLALSILSCPIGMGEEEESPVETRQEGAILDTRTFWAVDMSTEKYYQTRADLLAEGRYCKIWVEREQKDLVNSATARKIADDYDDIIYPRMIDAFGIEETRSDKNGLVMKKNTMEWADWYADGDGKLSILLLDIKDNYNPPANNGYTAGYFSYVNFLQQDYSNQTDMIYVDTYPNRPGERGSNVTLAHEMQHLMNFITSVLLRTENTMTYLMDTWINEGLSSAAEYVYLEEHDYHSKWFNTDQEGTIAKGNNFFIWGNYEGNSILDDYATVYLFFQWLRLQSGGMEIYKNIMASPDFNYLAVTKAADKTIPGKSYADWNVLLKTWMAANYVNAPSGPSVYKNDPVLKTVQAKTAPGEIITLRLLPGEGVYSKTSANNAIASYKFVPSGINIKYAGLSKAGTGAVNDDATYAGGALLTYNTNTNLKGSKETGWLTGVTDASEARFDGDARSIAGTAWEGPIRIDARDMLARNGHRGEGEGFDPDALLPDDRIFIREVHGE
jgi:hypothetical protein